MSAPCRFCGLTLVTYQALDQHEALCALIPKPTPGDLSERQRIDRLEALVKVLAAGILQHEYAKDLSRHGTEAALKAIVNDGDLNKALIEVANAAL